MARPKPEERMSVMSVQVRDSLRKSLETMAFAEEMKFPDLVRDILEKAVLKHERRLTK